MPDPKAIREPSDLPGSLTIIEERGASVTLSMPHRFGFDFHWLSEAAASTSGANFGLRLQPEASARIQVELEGSLRRVISLDERNWLRLQVFKRQEREFQFASRISVTAQASAPPDRLDELTAAILGAEQTQRLAKLFGWPAREGEPATLAEDLRTVLDLKDSIYRKAADALERRFTAELSYHYGAASEDTALIDCSFRFTEEGLLRYREALNGDYSALLVGESEHVHFRRAVLTHSLRRESAIELHLPFLGRKEWARRLEALARMEVECDAGGRVLVYHAEASDRISSRNSYQSVLLVAGGLRTGAERASSNFTITYAHARKLEGARAGTAMAPVLEAYGFEANVGRWLDENSGSLEATLILSVPGTLATAWLEAPGERESSFFEIYARVSGAVQRAMRRWLPFVYFEQAERFETIGAAYPLLVYQASRPFSGKPKSDFTYDVLNEDDMSKVFQTAVRALPRELARVHATLLARDRSKTAAYYHPSEARAIVADVRRKPAQLKSLLVADALFVNTLIGLGCRGRELRQEMSRDPQQALKDLVKFCAQFTKAFHGKLRRLYGGQDFLPFGSLLMVEATNALNTPSGTDSQTQAVLRVRGRAGRPEQTFVNAAFRP